MTDLLIFGARRNSLGEAVALLAEQMGMSVVTAGIFPQDEDEPCDGRDLSRVRYMLQKHTPELILITIGVNHPVLTGETDYLRRLRDSLEINCEVPMGIVHEALRLDPKPNAIVAISSNSAHIARTDSGPYCASKAALSMALRVAAREQGRVDGPIIYGYELGLLAGTPMTEATRAALGPQTPLSRMPGAEDGLDVQDVATTILSGLVRPWQGQNGTMIRLDAGEQ